MERQQIEANMKIPQMRDTQINKVATLVGKELPLTQNNLPQLTDKIKDEMEKTKKGPEGAIWKNVGEDKWMTSIKEENGPISEQIFKQTENRIDDTQKIIQDAINKMEYLNAA